MVDINSLTQKSQEALQDAQSVATRMRHTEVDGEHLLLALINQADGLVPRLLDNAGADTAAVQADLEAELERRPRVSGPGAAPGQVSVTARLAKVLDAAAREAKRLKDEYVSVEHLVIALAEEGKSTAAGRILASHGVTRDAFLTALTKIRGNQRVTSATPRVPTKHLRSTAATWSPRAGPEARPGDRPRRRDTQGDSDSQPQDEKQSGADR